MTTVEFNLKDTARPELKKLLKKATDPLPGLNIAGRAIANLLKAHYRQRDQEGNKLGGDRTHYWRQIAQAVNAPRAIEKNKVRVSISSPSLDPRRFGDKSYPVRAKKASALTIPIHPLAHGRRASVLEQKLGLKLFRVKETLVAKGADGKLTAYYVLRKEVTMQPDPRALPPWNLVLVPTAEKAFYGWLKN